MKALLAMYARYADLVRFQEAALEKEDLNRFEDLARARQEIQAEVDSVNPSLLRGDTLDPESQMYLEKVHEELRDALLRDARIRSRLQGMKKDASTTLRDVEDRGGRAREYLTGDEVHTPRRSNQVNIRL
jgi:hypothetical protein